jgi:hypothetical protein
LPLCRFNAVSASRWRLISRANVVLTPFALKV